MINDGAEATKGEEKRKEAKKGGGTHTIPAWLKAKGVLKITKKKAAPTEKQISADAHLQILEYVRARVEAKYEELYTIMHLKLMSLERVEGDKRIEFNSLIQRTKFRALGLEFLVAKFERANIDDGKKVAITDYLKQF